MRRETLQFELRFNGEDAAPSSGSPREIQEARLEPEGRVSVIKTPDSRPVQKKDLRLVR